MAGMSEGSSPIEHPPPATAPTGGLPRDTTPTWEMELLLSGATVFGLLQLPRQIDLLLFDAFGRVPGELSGLVLVTWVYAKSALLTIIVTFLLHLVLRGFWIALVGLDSVYPGGIRWDRLRSGPHQRAAGESRTPAMAVRIERADNRASKVYGVGVGLAFTVLVPLVLVLFGLAGYLLLRLLGVGEGFGLWPLLGIFGLVVAPFALLVVFDRRLGHRVPGDGKAGRALRAVFRGYHRIGFGRGANPLLALFQSHEGAWRTGVVVFLVIASVVTLVMTQFLGWTSGVSYGDFAGLPDDGPGASDSALPGHYASQRGTEPMLVPLPYLPDRVVRGPYLELFVPYEPRRHAPALRTACPAAVALAEGEEEAPGAARPALDCLASLLDLRVDGEPVLVALDASADPVSGARGLLAMIPAADLAPGRHLLTLRRLPRADRDPATVPPPYRIPFWR
jgi:hypothetical protein